VKYKVKIMEELSTDVDIDAGSREEAKKKAYDMWANGEVILGDRDFKGVHVFIVEPFDASETAIGRRIEAGFWD
jgi:hypothetical protein